MNRFVLLLIYLVSTVTATASAQDPSRIGIRAGAGTGGSGETVFVGQIEVSELAGLNSVELAVAGLLGGRSIENTRAIDRFNATHEYREDTGVVGIELTTNYLFRHAMEASGPYFLVGLGVGAYRVDWSFASPTDRRLGTPLTGGGSSRAQEQTLLGSMVNVGVGLRLHQHVDVRAMLRAMLLPGSDQRDLKLIPAVAATAGFGF